MLPQHWQYRGHQYSKLCSTAVDSVAGRIDIPIDSSAAMRASNLSTAGVAGFCGVGASSTGSSLIVTVATLGDGCSTLTPAVMLAFVLSAIALASATDDLVVIVALGVVGADGEVNRAKRSSSSFAELCFGEDDSAVAAGATLALAMAFGVAGL